MEFLLTLAMLFAAFVLPIQVSHRVVVPMNMIDVSRIHGQTFSIFYSHASRTRKISGGWGAQLTRNGEIAGMDSNVNY